ncbi:TlpA family protein disulfide reductase [Chitinophaga lutea]
MRAINEWCRWVLPVLLLMICPAVFAQGHQEAGYPDLRAPAPDYVLRNVAHYPKTTVRANDMKGKHVILDFWGVGCVVCIQSFPKMDSLQKKYAGRLQIFLVGLQEKNRDVAGYYEIFRKRSNLQLASASDSTTFKQFVPSTVPHLVWIDDKGIVQAVTLSEDVKAANIDSFLAGRPFPFMDVSAAALKARKMEVDPLKPLLIGGNGGNDTNYLYRSVLSRWRPGMGSASSPQIDDFLRRKGIPKYQATGVPADVLFLIAYFGTTLFALNDPGNYPYPIVHSGDSAVFRPQGPTGMLYNYELQVPPDRAAKNTLMRMMQRDLTNYFQVEGEVKEMEVPCLRLIVSDERKARKHITAGTPQGKGWVPERGYFETVNMPIGQLPKLLAYRLPGRAEEKYAIDDTHLDAPVSLQLHAEAENLDSIREALRKKGFDLVPGAIRRRALVVRDGKKLQQ